MEQFTHNQEPEKNTTSPEFAPQHDAKEKEEGFFSEIFRFSIIALLIVLPIRMFVAQPFIVSGASMETTFTSGQYLIVDQVTYRFEEPHRGDVVIFKYPKDPSKFFIKRIIGVPGDTIEVVGSGVTLKNATHPEGIILDEPYIHTMSPSGPLTETLGEGEYFVMGDNRDASSDSRTWGILPEENIVGRAFLRLFPFMHIDLLPGAYDTDSAITRSN